MLRSSGHNANATLIHVRSANESSPPSASASGTLGINRALYGQLAILGVSLACCGGIVGLSRLLPQLAEEKFHLKRYNFTAVANNGGE